MKIYILPVKWEFQQQPFRKAFPPHSFGYMMETDFHDWLKKQDFLTDDPEEADWHYLPIYWTFWNLSHDYGKTGKEELQNEVEVVLLTPGKTFTICQYDGGPGVNVRNTIVFLGAKTGRYGIPIPIITMPHKIPDKLPEKKWLASFMGKIRTHPSRKVMADYFKNKEDISIVDSSSGEEKFVNSILESYVTLCPRGSAMGSFRFYESMQLGVPPAMISNVDVRPFKKYIRWEDCSFFSKDPKGIDERIRRVDKETLLKMGQRAKEIWETQLYYQNWCKYVLMTLEDMKQNSIDQVYSYAKTDIGVRENIHNDFDKLLVEKNLNTGAEIGVWYGSHAKRLLDITKGKLYGVDPYIEMDATGTDYQHQYKWDSLYDFVIKKLKPYKDRYEHIRLASWLAKNKVPDDLDYVYIDGDHSFKSCLRDIRDWFPKVRKGGIIGGDDYGHNRLRGVKKAVDSYFKKVNLGGNGVWWIQK